MVGKNHWGIWPLPTDQLPVPTPSTAAAPCTQALSIRGSSFGRHTFGSSAIKHVGFELVGQPRKHREKKQIGMGIQGAPQNTLRWENTQTESNVVKAKQPCVPTLRCNAFQAKLRRHCTALLNSANKVFRVEAVKFPAVQSLDLLHMSNT